MPILNREAIQKLVYDYALKEGLLTEKYEDIVFRWKRQGQFLEVTDTKSLNGYWTKGR